MISSAKLELPRAFIFWYLAPVILRACSRRAVVNPHTASYSLSRIQRGRIISLSLSLSLFLSQLSARSFIDALPPRVERWTLLMRSFRSTFHASLISWACVWRCAEDENACIRDYSVVLLPYGEPDTQWFRPRERACFACIHTSLWDLTPEICLIQHGLQCIVRAWRSLGGGDDETILMDMQTFDDGLSGNTLSVPALVQQIFIR